MSAVVVAAAEYVVVAVPVAADYLPGVHALASEAAGTRAWPMRTRQSGPLCGMLGSFG